MLNQTEGAPNRNGYGGFAKFITNYKLKGIWDLQLAANYFSPTTITQGYIKAYGNMDAAITTRFHGLVLATLAGTPVVSADLSHGKHSLLFKDYLSKYSKNVMNELSTVDSIFDLVERLINTPTELAFSREDVHEICAQSNLSRLKLANVVSNALVSNQNHLNLVR